MHDVNTLSWTLKASKQLLMIDKRYIKPIKEAVATLIHFPNVNLDIKKLKGEDNLYRIRLGKYRVLFTVIDGEPRIICIQAVKRRTDQTYN